MRLKNTTDIPNEIIRDIVRFVRPPGIKNFRVIVNKSSRRWGGWGAPHGVKIKINTSASYPKRFNTYQYGQLRGRRYYHASLVEALIYLFAHELMHTRQGQKGNIRGRVFGARGRYSEIETESFAIRKLRDWRCLYPRVSSSHAYDEKAKE